METESETRITEEVIREKKIAQYTKCFVKLPNERFSCKVEKCSRTFLSTTTAIRHLHHHHESICSVIDENRSDIQKEKSQGEIETRIKLNPSQFWKTIVTMIIFSALPLSFVESQGYRIYSKPFLIAFELCNVKFTLNTRHLKLQIHDIAAKMKKKIQNETKKKMVCLLMDIASRHNRSVFGVSISFWSNG